MSETADRLPEAPSSETHDLEALRHGLRRWLKLRMPAARGLAISGLCRPQGGGSSSETYLFRVDWQDTERTASKELVLRLKPRRMGVYPEYDLPLQCRVLEILGERSDVPVPRVLDFERSTEFVGTPFYVMYRVRGRAPGDYPPMHAAGWFSELPAAEQRAIWWNGIDVLTRVHAVDWRQIGLGFLHRPTTGATALEQQLSYYRAYYDWAAEGERYDLVEHAFDWIDRNRPAEDDRRLSWGDARIGNMIFDDERCAAVLDWEMVGLGDPAVDVGWWLVGDELLSTRVGIPRAPGVPSEEETIAYYEKRSGRRLSHLHFYKTFALFRLSIIMIRMFKIMTTTSGGNTPRDNLVTRYLAEILDCAA